MHQDAHKQHDFRDYLWRFVATLLCTLLAVAAVNLWVDPYRLFGVLGETAVNRVKARPGANIGEIKLLNAVRARPTAVIIGNSRADIGFRPDHPAWRAHAGRVYNMAVPGAGIQRVRDEFRALLEQDPGVTTVVLAVDFQDFVLNATNTGAAPRRPAIDTQSLLLRERLKALFTLAALGDSTRTLLASRDAHAATLQADGLNPLRDYIPIAAREGYPAMFRQRLDETGTNFSRARRGIYPPGASDSDEFAALRDILDMAARHRVTVYVVTYPYHAQYYALYQELGLWPELERWKRDLLRTIDTARARAPGEWRVELWDFAALSSPAVSAVLDTGESGAGQWYWEAGHFKPALGDLVLEAVLSDSVAGSDPVGIQLTAANIDDWLVQQRAELARYATDRPEQWSAVVAALANGRDASKRRDNLSR